MCLNHPLRPKTGEEKKMTIQEYEEKIGSKEIKYLQEGGDFQEFFNPEIGCIYDYNLELLYHLLSSERRGKVIDKIFEENLRDASMTIGYVFCRTLAWIRLSGDYTPEEIETITRKVYESKIRVVGSNNKFILTQFETYEKYVENINWYEWQILECRGYRMEGLLESLAGSNKESKRLEIAKIEKNTKNRTKT